MRQAITIILVFLPILLTAQKSIRFFGGINYTKTYYTKLEYGFTADTLNTIKRNNDAIILPHIGFEYDFKTYNKLSFTTGLGVSMMGAANYDTLSSQSYPLPPKYTQRENKDLKITYLRIPLMAKYELLDNFYLFAGYTLQYSIRKNQTILAANNLGTFPPQIGFIYRNYHHAAIFGFRKDWKFLSISANYHLGLSRVYDTEIFRPYERAYLSLSGIQFSVGYKISE